MTDYSKLTVVKLKEELKRRGLPQAGLKAALCARLEEDDAAQVAALPEESAAGPELKESIAPTKDEEKGKESPVDKVPVSQSAELSTVEDGRQGAPAERNPVCERKDIPIEETVAAQNDDASESADTATLPEPDLQDDRMQDVTEAPLESSDSAGPAVQAPPEERVSKDSQAQSINVPSRPATVVTHPMSQTQTSMQLDAAPLPTSEIQGSQSQAQPSGQPLISNTQTTVDVEEVIEDHRKRKRRSHSPMPLTQEVAMKKLKSEDGSPRPRPQASSTDAQSSLNELHKSEAASESKPTQSPLKSAPTDARFKGLFGPAPAAADLKVAMVDADRDVAPALHPATSTLYIRNLMRPLQVPTLRDHLAVLAQEDNTKPTEVFREFFVDAIKSHCLVQFHSIAAASRVRGLLHDVVWPDEKNRKPLWVDFIPDTQMTEWMHMEQDASKAWPPKRWEATYESKDGTVTVSLREVGAAAGRDYKQPPGASTRRDAPRPVLSPTPKGDVGRGFRALDDLFRSTAAKPKLYFLPVPERTALARLDLLAAGRDNGDIGGGSGGGDGGGISSRDDEMRRFTFENERLVDDGPEFRPGYRGGMRGGRRGGGRGGDSYRGRYA